MSGEENIGPGSNRPCGFKLPGNANRKEGGKFNIPCGQLYDGSGKDRLDIGGKLPEGKVVLFASKISLLNATEKV